ncbi:MAG: hypothetical protein ACYC27_09370 [Armatimonadota bacterium]
MYREIFQFVLTNQLPGMIGIVVFWTVLGGLLGLLLGLLVFIKIRALGGYRLEWRYAVWLRVLTGVLMVGCTIVCGTMIGFYDGVWRGVQKVAVQGDLGTQVMPRVDGYGAQFIAGVYSMCPSVDGTENPVITQKEMQQQMASFADGKWEIDVSQMQSRVSSIHKHTIDSAIQYLLHDSRIRYPEKKDTVSDKILYWFLQRIGEGMLPAKVKEVKNTVQDSNMAKFTRKLLRDLPSEAAKNGNPQTIGYMDLSAYLARKSMQPLIIIPVRGFARTHQAGFGIFLLLTLVLPVAVFRLAHYIHQRRASKIVAESAGDKD